MGSLNAKTHIVGTEHERMRGSRYWKANELRRLVTAHNKVYVSMF